MNEAEQSKLIAEVRSMKAELRRIANALEKFANEMTVEVEVPSETTTSTLSTLEEWIAGTKDKKQ